MKSKYNNDSPVSYNGLIRWICTVAAVYVLKNG